MPPVLAVLDAIAVQVPGAAAGRHARTDLAQAALSRATGRNLRLIRRPSGRPALLPPERELGVSLSHRGDWLLAGCSPGHDIGVDIEIDDPEIEPLSMAGDHFTPGEAAAVASMGTRARDLFFRLWVAKEAALKATGRGIYDGLLTPDFAPDIASLLRDGVPTRVWVGEERRTVSVAVTPLPVSGPLMLYGALAVLEV